MASLTAFNTWLDEDWGFDHEGRILSAPMLSLADPEAAVVELDRVLAAGAKIVHLRPAPVPGEHGTSRSFGHPAHDPFWARLVETSTPVAFHLGDSGYNAFSAMWGGTAKFLAYGRTNSLSKILVSDRAIHDTVASMVVDGVFYRFPELRVASIENGSDWVALLVKRLKKQANQTPWDFEEAPLDTMRRNLWVTPYYEEDVSALAELIGVEKILFGSDWPHGEGLARAHRLREGAPRLRRGRHPQDHARQRPRPARHHPLTRAPERPAPPEGGSPRVGFRHEVSHLSLRVPASAAADSETSSGFRNL